MPDPVDRTDYRVVLGHMAQVCHGKRTDLLGKFRRQQKWSRHAQLASGILALISGLFASAVFVDTSPTGTAKLTTAVLAFLSAAINLYATIYLSNSDDMLAGAAEFLSLRTKLDIARGKAGMDRAEIDRTMESLNTQYVDACGKYDRYLRGSSHHHEWTG